MKAFDNCPALDGYHCQTNSLAKIYYHNNCPLSEDMLLGLGAGMGFMYWQQKGVPPFIGGRGNTKEFFNDIGRRTGVQIRVESTSSGSKAERILLAKLLRQEPVMVYADMAFLPWFDLPADYHFGGHTFVVCGYDCADSVLGSDMDQKSTGLKKGFYHPLSLEQLRKARSSPFKPFPPKNANLEFDFSVYHPPHVEDIYDAIEQMVTSMLEPPISNFGVKGIRRTAKEIRSWPKQFNDFELRMNLFNIYIFIEVGGTGGGCFRYMYSRFLKEAAAITSNKRLEEASRKIDESGQLFTKLGLLFQDAENVQDITDRIGRAVDLYGQIADLEEELYRFLSR